MTKKVLNILVVDDDESITTLLKLYLSSLGHFVETGNAPKKILEQNFRQKFDLVITDLDMPDMTGYQFIERLRERAHMKFTPFVVLTANAEMPQIKVAAGLGALDYIVKPFDKEVGLEKLKRIFKKLAASEVQLPKGAKIGIAVAENQIEMLSVGEDFIKVLTNFAVPNGTPLRLRGEWFTQLNLNLDALVVEDCSPTDEGFILFLRIPGNIPAVKISIREWMNRFN